jgi:regulator-associated protein of mTOR
LGFQQSGLAFSSMTFPMHLSLPQSYTQYIPLSIYDLQMWMGSPSIYVYDCSNAGIILESFKQFSTQREQEVASMSNGSGRFKGGNEPAPSSKNCIQLAACGPNELLPMNPELPADLFTACLTTPIKVALRWLVILSIKFAPRSSVCFQVCFTEYREAGA